MALLLHYVRCCSQICFYGFLCAALPLYAVSCGSSYEQKQRRGADYGALPVPTVPKIDETEKRLSFAPSNQERRGIWITNVASPTLESRTQMRQFLRTVRQAGFNTVFPVVWNAGVTLFPSPTVAKTDGSVTTAAKRNVLAELIEEAQQAGLWVIPWFEWGTKIPFSKGQITFPLGTKLAEKGLLLKTKTGGLKITFDAYEIGVMDPVQEGTRQFFINLVREVATLPVQGIMFDDHLSAPAEFVPDPQNVKSWCEKRSCPKAWSQEERQKDYLTTGLTELVGALSVQSRKSGKPFVLSPGGHNSYTKEKFRVDWVEMSKAGHLDEVLLQIYRDGAQFDQDLFPPTPSAADKQRLENLEIVQKNTKRFGIGILTGLGDSHAVDGRRILTQVRKVREKNWGVGLFYDGSLWKPAHGEQASARQCLINGLFSEMEPQCQ